MNKMMDEYSYSSSLFAYTTIKENSFTSMRQKYKENVVKEDVLTNSIPVLEEARYLYHRLQ